MLQKLIVAYKVKQQSTSQVGQATDQIKKKTKNSTSLFLVLNLLNTVCPMIPFFKLRMGYVFIDVKSDWAAESVVLIRGMLPTQSVWNREK